MGTSIARTATDLTSSTFHVESSWSITNLKLARFERGNCATLDKCVALIYSQLLGYAVNSFTTALSASFDENES
jgi:hypothetical protein